MTAFKEGTYVRKSKGYPYFGTVQSAFYNRAGQLRYVVEMYRDPPHYVDGDMLHIFSPEQLEFVLPGDDEE